jgi:hypothetical protein
MNRERSGFDWHSPPYTLKLIAPAMDKRGRSTNRNANGYHDDVHEVGPQVRGQKGDFARAKGMAVSSPIQRSTNLLLFAETSVFARTGEILERGNIYVQTTGYTRLCRR